MAQASRLESPLHRNRGRAAIISSAESGGPALADFDRPADAVIDTDPATSAGFGLRHLDPALILFENILGAHRFTTASLFTKVSVDGDAHALPPGLEFWSRAPDCFPGNVGPDGGVAKLAVGWVTLQDLLPVQGAEV
jgi:hypothetical protein